VGVGGKGWEINTHFLRYLLKNVDNSSEGKIVLNSNFILKNLKCTIHKNSALLFEKHKHKPKTDTVILTNVTTVTVASILNVTLKQRVPKGYVICKLLDRFRHPKNHRTPWSN
jgi:hypothetical protein